MKQVVKVQEIEGEAPWTGRAQILKIAKKAEIEKPKKHGDELKPVATILNKEPGGE